MTALTTYGWVLLFGLFLVGFVVVGILEWWENR